MADHRSIGESSPAAPQAAGRMSSPTTPPSNGAPHNGSKRGSFARAVGSFVPRLTQKAMQKFGFSTAALLTDWPSIVGAELARHTTPQRLKWPRMPDTQGETSVEQGGRPGATLHLQVDAIRALDVQYKTRQIIERINSYFGYRAVAELRIVQVPLAAERHQLPRDVVTCAPSHPRSPTGSGTDLSTVTDDRLRAALERLQNGLARK